MNELVMTVRNTENEAYREYPVNRLRLFGGIHISIGVLSIILGITAIIIDIITMSKDCYIYENGTEYYDKFCDDYSFETQSFIFFDILCFLFSGWFILTGCFPFCMTQKRQSSWRCLKKAFMVCSIVGASTFVPTVFSFGVIGTSRANFEGQRTGAIALSYCFAVLGFVEFVIAIAAASFCCCCTPWEKTDRSEVYINSGQHTHIVGMPNTRYNQSEHGQDGFTMRS
ncbi:uncharacterized protein LOC134684659 [Mytilus trossulus]|uniref:uncharacterized protein LOC134684659 n=1 Tax=Mytilus trossulus TaxID=6551 RepID=UPI0030049368